MYKHKKIIAIIPARAGSKRVANKNTALLNGKHLIEYTIQAALSCELIDKIIVTTNDPAVMKISASYPIKLIKRPQELAGDDTPTLPVIKHALEQINWDGDVIIILQPTSPLRSVEDINITIKELIDFKADSAETLVETHPIEYMFRLNKEGWAIPLNKEGLTKSSNQLERVFLENGAVFAITKETIMQNTLYGKKHRGIVMPKNRSVDINDKWDFLIAECFMKNGKNN